MIEVKIRVSDEDSMLIDKYLIHGEILCISHDDKTLQKLVNDSIDKFKGEPKDVLLTFKYVW